MIELKNISKKYGGRQALQNVTLTIPQGKIIGLVGENGSGKTTLLKLMAGLLTPDEGKATYGGSPITRRIAEHIAYMPDTDLFILILQFSNYSIFTLHNLMILML